MTIKTQHLFWLLMAVIAGAWPLMLPAAHGNTAQTNHAELTTISANG